MKYINYYFLCCVALLLTAYPRVAFTKITSNPPIIRVDVTVSDFNSALLRWMEKRVDSGHPEDGGHKTVHMPILNLYDAKGKILYAGSQSDANARFLQALGSAPPAAPTGEINKSGLSLHDYLTELKALIPYRDAVEQSHKPVLFAVTYLGRPFCAAENAALIKLENGPLAAKYQIVVVQLHSGD